MIDETNDILSSFLKNLAFSLEKNELSPENIAKIGEFYMAYKFNEREKDFNEVELKKFIFLGWYIYDVILKNYKFE